MLLFFPMVWFAAIASTALGEAATPRVIRDWLVIGPLDQRGRRAFNPSAVLAHHLLDRAVAPPIAGDTLTGELGRPQAWQTIEAGANGQLDGAFAAAFTTVEWPAAEVVLAELTGAATLWVNGIPQIGDVYGDGCGGLPIALREGANQLFVTGIRGGFRLALAPPPAELLFNPFDATVGDLVAGAPASVHVGLVVINATDRLLPRLELDFGSDRAEDPIELGTASDPAGLGPRALLKIPLELFPRVEHPLFAAPGRVEVAVRLRAGALAASTTITLEIKDPLALRRASYWSAVDGSVQQYAIVPPSDGSADAVVLALHGAGVDCAGHAAAYSSKPDFWIVAPNNRRRFGFDWQDWGRRDAYDVLDHFSSSHSIDPRQRYLTGHSMGGHGTWHLAANDPATFAAIAPSAGWASFDSYGGRPAGPLAALWQTADGASRTLTLIDNLTQVPTFVLHGSADDNVPASEAQALLEALRNSGAMPASHIEEGAGHWWDGGAAPGADCVDWPALFDHFRASRRPERIDHLTFTGNDPSTQAQCDWVRVVELLRYGEPFRIDARFDPAAAQVTVVSRNVSRLELRAPDDAAEVSWTIDGEELPAPTLPEWAMSGDPAQDAAELKQRSKRREFLLGTSGWEPWDPWAALRAHESWTFMRKESGFAASQGGGPFKRAFDNEFVLIHGTEGDAAEDEELRERARFDAAHWWYRGNGHARCLTDLRWLQLCATARDGELETNVILYGNRDSNAAWAALVPEDAPFDARRGELRIGERRFTGDALCAAVVLPNPRLGLLGLIADSGARGTRLGYALTPFISGVGYPDWTLFSTDVLTKGDDGVLAAGWFDALWRPQPDR